MDINIFMTHIAAAHGLGTPSAPPEQVSGGLMHKMYKLTTADKAYAVKCLNPAIMRRPAAPGNYALAERLEAVLNANGLPIVPAHAFGGRKMQEWDGQSYYVFDWVAGKALAPGEITPAHCEIIGGFLARMHGLERRDTPIKPHTLQIDWDKYITMAETNNTELADMLKTNCTLLYTLVEAGNAAWARIPAVSCICNGDMDSKNVLWENGVPNIIDLECLNYGNPYTELFQLAISWAADEQGQLVASRLQAFIQAYRREAGTFEVDWTALYDSNTGMMEWLEYSLKRALGIECADEAERRLGLEQAHGAMSQIAVGHTQKTDILKELINF